MAQLNFPIILHSFSCTTLKAFSVVSKQNPNMLARIKRTKKEAPNLGTGSDQQ